jgi:hypothetical protein
LYIRLLYPPDRPKGRCKKKPPNGGLLKQIQKRTAGSKNRPARKRLFLFGVLIHPPIQCPTIAQRTKRGKIQFQKFGTFWAHFLRFHRKKPGYSGAPLSLRPLRGSRLRRAPSYPLRGPNGEAIWPGEFCHGKPLQRFTAKLQKASPRRRQKIQAESPTPARRAGGAPK